MQFSTLLNYLGERTITQINPSNNQSNIVACVRENTQLELIDDRAEHISLRSNDDLNLVRSKINHLLTLDVKADKIVNSMQQNYLRSNSIIQLADDIKSTFQTSFSVLSIDGEILMSAGHHNVVWDYPNLTILKSAMNTDQSEIRIANQTIFLKKIKLKNKIIGSLALSTASSKLNDLDSLVLEKIVALLSLVFQNRLELKTNKSKFYNSSLLSNLIHSDQLNQIDNDKEFTKLKEIQYLFILKLPVSTSDIYIQSLIEQLSIHLKDSYYCIDNGNLIILTSYDRLLLRTDEDFQAFTAYLSKNKIKVSVSMPFNTNSQIRLYYHQALVALSYQSSSEINDNPIMYQDISLLEIVANLKEQSNIENYIHPDISFLLNYDQTHGSDYLNTLHIYLYNDLNTHISAEMLNIHPNTLLYRIGKIKELLAYNLDFGKQNLDYRMSFLILYTLNRIELPLLRNN